MPAEDLADVLDSLIWVLDDNGAEINEARRRWIEGDDPYAAELAIQMNESIPYEPKLMASKLDALEARWPHLSLRCQQLRARLAGIGNTSG